MRVPVCEAMGSEGNAAEPTVTNSTSEVAAAAAQMQ